MAGSGKWLGSAPVALALVTVGLVPALAGSRQCDYNLPSHATLTVVNTFGKITVKPAASPHRLTLTATPASDKVEVDCGQAGSRVDAMSHFLQDADENDGRVDYEIGLPPATTLSIRNAAGATEVSGLSGDVTLRSDTAPISAAGLQNIHLHVITISGPVKLSDIRGSHVEVLSTGGDVAMTNVIGQKVSASTTSGNISYDGDFAGGGEYSLSNHSGNIEVTLPATASVDLDARSSRGAVENDFPLREKTHLLAPLPYGHSFAGTSHSGSSLVQLRTFSGKIRVRKR